MYCFCNKKNPIKIISRKERKCVDVCQGSRGLICGSERKEGRSMLQFGKETFLDSPEGPTSTFPVSKCLQTVWRVFGLGILGLIVFWFGIYSLHYMRLSRSKMWTTAQATDEAEVNTRILKMSSSSVNICLHHRWQTQGPRAESSPLPGSSAELSLNREGVVMFIQS